ncbi:MAG: LysR family transcriptional regulator [Candidatus Gastranaerophilales bacterium]|nr:LysR family transcriptional regulator [Candidatus Gastranaerophilales bacterium]
MVNNNLEYYKVFYYVAKLGSVTGAARELSLSQPAVSQALRQLEGNLGVLLFARVARGVKLTGEGRLLFSYVEKGYEQIELGEAKLRQMQELGFGEIRIGASDMTLKYYLLPYLEQFHEQYPNVKVIVTNAPTPETLQFLREGKIDFGIVSTPFEGSRDMRSAPVREIEDVFVAGRRFIAYKNRTLDLQMLQELPMICLEEGTSTRSYMDSFLAKSQVVIRPEFELATSDMIVQFALRSLGVGCVVRDFAQEYLESGQLFELRFNQMIPKRQFCVVYSVRAGIPAAVRKLFEIMELKTK